MNKTRIEKIFLIRSEYEEIKISKEILNATSINYLLELLNYFPNKLIYFENCTFKSEFKCKEKKVNFIFKNCTFEGNVRIDNLRCKKLEFKDCRFLDGGGIKNRDGNKKLIIETLIFKPYELEGDFVIDIGGFANSKGLIDSNRGVIKRIEFENHQKGDGRVFFVGLTEKTEGDFRNRILDKVIFENCDLRNCAFLNSKVDKTEFRNIKFDKTKNLAIERLFEDRIEKGSFIKCIGLLILFHMFLFFPFFKGNDFLSYIFWLIILGAFLLFFIMMSLSIDTCYTKFLSGISIFLDPNNNSYLNKHISTYDEKSILKKFSKLRENKKNNYTSIVESLRALKELYDQLAINFLKTDKQLWGEFMYSSKFYRNIIEKENFIDVFPNRFNHLINCYGRRWFRTLWWIIVIIFYFGFLFTAILKPNIDYISTTNTPYFLIENATVNLKTGRIDYNKSSSFISSLHINGDWNQNKNNNNNLYGYDNRFNFNNLNTQYILKLKEGYITGLCKSFSNILYPLSFENKKWFDNVTPKAFILSIIESIILWILILALFRALWNVVLY